MNETPCGNLLHCDEASETPRCAIGRDFPAECHLCAAYVPGINEDERLRCEAWMTHVLCPREATP